MMPKSTIQFLFHMWAMGCTPSLAFSKVPDARRQGVTTEGVSAILRREERPQATQQAVPCWWIRVMSIKLTLPDGTPYSLEYEPVILMNRINPGCDVCCLLTGYFYSTQKTRNSNKEGTDGG